MRVVGVDVSRAVAEIAYLEHGRVQRFAKEHLRSTDDVVLEAAGNTAAIVETPKPFVSSGCCQPFASALDRGGPRQDG